jgi:acetyltransferase-like isoleucine patch superfamily enzyme
MKLLVGAMTSAAVTQRQDRCTERPSDGPRSALWYWPRHAGFFRTSGRFFVVWLSRRTPSFRLKNWMLRTFLRARVHKHAAIGLEVTFDVFFPRHITVEEDAVVGYNTTILCHEYMADRYRIGPVVISKRATIGANCTLLPGVIVGEGATVSAMSLVNRDIPPGELWGGVPVKKLRSAGETETREGEGRT